MSRITEELLRKRAEHNEGCLSTLEEVALHQQELIKIENLDKLCRHLKILYLQNNIISKIENLNKLKELDYLNLALNNIVKLEGLEGCESLRKLDLTINFIDIDDYVESLKNLQQNKLLRELYLTGNPITDWKGYRELTIAMLQQLDMLDGKEITKSERIIAKQKLEELLIEAESYYQIVLIQRRQKESEKVEIDYNDPDRKTEHNPEERTRMYLEIKQQKEEEEKRKNPDKYKPKKPLTSIYKNGVDGDLRQCNEGKYPYQLSEFDDPKYSFFAIEVPKYLDTSKIDVNLYPLAVSIFVKDKLTQVRLQDEILVEQSQIQRSSITGKISIKMPKLNPNHLIERINNKQKEILKNQKEEQLFLQKQKLTELDEIEKKITNRKIDTQTFTQPQFQEDYDDMPDLE